MHMTTWRAPGESDIVPGWTMADRLRKAREFAGLGQGELAADIDVSRGTVSNYEAERVTPRRLVVRQWALRCGVSFDWVWSGTAETSDGPDSGPETAKGRTFNPWVVGSSPTGPTRLAEVIDLGERRAAVAA